MFMFVQHSIYIKYAFLLMLMNPLPNLSCYKEELELKPGNIRSVLHLFFTSCTWTTEQTVSQQQVCLGQPQYQQDLDSAALFGVTQAAVKKSMAC